METTITKIRQSQIRQVRLDAAIDEATDLAKRGLLIAELLAEQNYYAELELSVREAA